MRPRLEQLRAWLTSRPAAFRALPGRARYALIGATAIFVLGVLAALLVPRPRSHAPESAKAPSEVPATADLPESESESESEADDDVDVKPMPATVTVTFTVTPTVREAWVSWGKKKLGRIIPRHPLVVVRPRDSGPLDVVVRADGYFPVHTRAHTFSDNKLTVKLTPLDQPQTLLGYRVPLDAGGAALLDDPDAGIESPFPTP